MTTVLAQPSVMPAEEWTHLATPRPLPSHGGTVRDLLRFLRTQDILEGNDLASFAADVEAGRQATNQPLGKSLWDS